MEKFNYIFFWLCACSLLLGSLCVIFAKQKKVIFPFLTLIFISYCGLFILLKSLFNAAAELVFAFAAVIVTGFITNVYVKKERSLGVKISPRMFLGGACLFVMFGALLWAVVNNYLSGILDMLPSESLFEDFNFNFSGFWKGFVPYVLDWAICCLAVLVIGLGVGVFNFLKHKEGVK